MNYYLDIYICFGSYYVTSLRWFYSIEDYNEKHNDYTNIIEEKMILEWFFWTYWVDYKEYRECTKNVCPYQPMHKISLSCNNCENVHIDYYYSYKNNPTCSHDCYVKFITIPSIDCDNNFLKRNVSLRCSSCSVLNKNTVENTVPKN